MIACNEVKQSISDAASRPFDVHRWSDYPELENCLTGLMEELETLEAPRDRKRGESQRKKFREALRCLVLDMYVAWKADPNLVVGIPLANGEYASTSRYRALFLHWTTFKAAYDSLKQADYIAKVKNGHFDHATGTGETTRIRATEKLIRLLTVEAQLTIPRISSRISDRQMIILRGAKPKGRSGKSAPDVEYVDTTETETMRNNMHRINERLQRHWIDLRITDEEFERLQRRMRRNHLADTNKPPFIDFTHRALVRIFNNSDWQQGGRFYRGWWQSIPSKYRQHITIDDKATRELDFSNLHPVLLYAEVGERLEGDAYSIASSNIPRGLIKTTFNKMLNASGRLNKPYGLSEDEIGMSWTELQDAIAERHAPIKHLFKTGHGLRLQRTDSDIAQAVMLRFQNMRYPCLPVHDSFLVHHALVDELKTIMVDEFKAMTGKTVEVKEVDRAEPEYDFDKLPEALSMEPNESLLKGVGDYASYDQRILDWRYSNQTAGRL